MVLVLDDLQKHKHVSFIGFAQRDRWSANIRLYRFSFDCFLPHNRKKIYNKWIFQRTFSFFSLSADTVFFNISENVGKLVHLDDNLMSFVLVAYYAAT